MNRILVAALVIIISIPLMLGQAGGEENAKQAKVNSSRIYVLHH